MQETDYSIPEAGEVFCFWVGLPILVMLVIFAIADTYPIYGWEMLVGASLSCLCFFVAPHFSTKTTRFLLISGLTDLLFIVALAAWASKRLSGSMMSLIILAFLIFGGIVVSRYNQRLWASPTPSSSNLNSTPIS